MTLITRRYKMGELQSMHAAHSDLLDWLYENLGPKVGEPPDDWPRAKPFSEQSLTFHNWNNMKLLYFVTRGIPDFEKDITLLNSEWGDTWWVCITNIWEEHGVFSCEMAVEVPNDVIATQIKLAFL
jgi:hypothetical protein